MGAVRIADEPMQAAYLYRVEDIATFDLGQPVLVTGSRKATDALRATGLQAVGVITESPGRVDAGIVPPLAGHRIVLVPPRTLQGTKLMHQLRDHLDGLASEIYWYVPEEGAKPGWDWNDLLFPGMTPADLQHMSSVPATEELRQTAIRRISDRIYRDGEMSPFVLERIGGQRLDRVMVPARPEPPLLGHIEPQAGKLTTLFGPGGVGKGLEAASWVAQMTRQGKNVLILDYEGHGDEWASRVASLGGDMTRGIIVEPNKRPLDADEDWRPVPFWESASDYSTEAFSMNAALVVVDSIVSACIGHDVSLPETPILFAAGVSQYDCPVLALGHINRVGDYRMPFGSIFWHNICRMSWSLAPQNDPEAPRLLVNRKAQHYRPMGTFLVEFDWNDDRIVGVIERPYRRPVGDRITSVLVPNVEGMTEADIVTAVDEDGEGEVKPNTVNKWLNRQKDKPEGTVMDPATKRWRLADR